MSCLIDVDLTDKCCSWLAYLGHTVTLDAKQLIWEILCNADVTFVGYEVQSIKFHMGYFGLIDSNMM